MSTPIGRWIARWTQRTLLVTLATFVVTYCGDWAIFMLRSQPTNQITVNKYLTLPLKDNKVEYDFEGTLPETCAQSLYPRNGSVPCWYLSRHPTQVDHL
ncbi:hypothetical protein [Acidicapsa ligni]|uniref:hypothetical protein n=1 Tax=Acidicapsa ligni TaxID=542300 RepID=UPI0021DF663B|nr:hypothetical protein [Acidicapsa ligni]